jgi:hypothetical protein
MYFHDKKINLIDIGNLHAYTFIDNINIQFFPNSN